MGGECAVRCAKFSPTPPAPPSPRHSAPKRKHILIFTFLGGERAFAHCHTYLCIPLKRISNGGISKSHRSHPPSHAPQPFRARRRKSLHKTGRGVSQLSFIPTFKCVSAHGRAHTHIIRVVVVRSRQSKRYYDGGGGGMCGSVRDSNCVELVIIIIRLAQTERDAVAALQRRRHSRIDDIISFVRDNLRGVRSAAVSLTEYRNVDGLANVQHAQIVQHRVRERETGRE